MFNITAKFQMLFLLFILATPPLIVPFQNSPLTVQITHSILTSLNVPLHCVNIRIFLLSSGVNSLISHIPVYEDHRYEGG